MTGLFMVRSTHSALFDFVSSVVDSLTRGILSFATTSVPLSK